MQNLNSMVAKLAWALFCGASLLAAPLTESAATQEFRLSLDRLSYLVNSQTVELNLMQERLLQLEKSLQHLQQTRTIPSEKSLEKRTGQLEKGNDTLIQDLKLLKSHLNETTSTVSALQNQLQKIETQLTSDISSLKHALQTMLTLLQGETKSYTVKSGDSLGQIALDHKTDTKTLKKLNNLTNDTIFAGQKLLLP